MARLALTLFFALLAPRASAEPRLPGGDDGFFREEASAFKRDRGPSVSPLSLALSLSFDATTWSRVGVSTSPVLEVARLMRAGTYRLELLQLVLLAREGGRDLSGLAARREKGESFRDIAGSLSMDHDRVYDQALAMVPLVEEWERRVASVEPLERGKLPSRKAAAAAGGPSRGAKGLPGMTGGPR